MSHLVSAPAQQRQRRQARAVDMTKKRNAPAPVFVPEDLEPHEKECLLQTAVELDESDRFVQKSAESTSI